MYYNGGNSSLNTANGLSLGGWKGISGFIMTVCTCLIPYLSHKMLQVNGTGQFQTLPLKGLCLTLMR